MIEEVSQDAIDQISELVCERASDNGTTFSWEDARGEVRLNILDAKKAWGEQVDAFQALLIRNGIQPLSHEDLDGPIWSPKSYGIK